MSPSGTRAGAFTPCSRPIAPCEVSLQLENLKARTEGSGLGLAIARNAAERNGIGLELGNRVDGSGLIARLRFENATALTTSAPAWAAEALPVRE